MFYLALRTISIISVVDIEGVLGKYKTSHSFLTQSNRPSQSFPITSKSALYFLI